MDPIKVLQAIRDFIRDVGTPAAILVFVALLYTGWLHSPLTDIAAGTAATLANDATLMKQHEDELQTARIANNAILAVLKRTCRNAAKSQADRDLCDDPEQYKTDAERWPFKKW